MSWSTCRRTASRGFKARLGRIPSVCFSRRRGAQRTVSVIWSRLLHMPRAGRLAAACSSSVICCESPIWTECHSLFVVSARHVRARASRPSLEVRCQSRVTVLSTGYLETLDLPDSSLLLVRRGSVLVSVQCSTTTFLGVCIINILHNYMDVTPATGHRSPDICPRS